MAQWKETLEPYVKVIESVKTAPLNPTAGEDLIIGAVIISDAGPSVPTLISSQKDFLATYSSKDLNKDYTDSLNPLYTSDPGSNLASTMWLNAYRLSGSANLLVSRATKKGSGNYVKPITTDSNESRFEYIVKDTEILKKVNPFRLSIDTTHNDGWALAVNEVGIIGNLVNDNGPVYEFFADNMPDLVDMLNSSSKFFSPDYIFLSAEEGDTTYTKVSPDDVDDDNKANITGVLFNEVYLSENFLDKTWNSGSSSSSTTSQIDTDGYAYVIPTTSITGSGSSGDTPAAKNYTYYVGTIHCDDDDHTVSDLFKEVTDINLFEHATEKTLTSGSSSSENTKTSNNCYYLLIPSGITITSSKFVSGDTPSTISLETIHEPITKIINGETVEFTVYSYIIGTLAGVETSDPSSYVTYTTSVKAATAGTPSSDRTPIGGRESDSQGEIILTQSNISSYSSNIVDLNSNNYSGFEACPYYATNVFNTSTNLKIRIRRFNHNAVTTKTTSSPEESPWIPNGMVLDKYAANQTKSVLKYDFYEVAVFDPAISEDWQLFNIGNISGRGDITVADLNEMLEMIQVRFPDDLRDLGLSYWRGLTDTTNQIVINDLGINTQNSSLLNVSDNDLMQAWDKIEEDERYIVEGMCDCGNTYSILQNYMANMAVNSNYFYPISCTYSTNYMTIASKASKIVQDTNKIWFGGNYDMDDGTVGYLFNFGSSGMFWETVCKNRRNNNEFAGVFGQNTGIAPLVKLSKDFTKKERQLLLTKNINTVFHDLYIERYYWNDNKVGQSEENVLSEECNTRLQIRISKAMPVLLNQFKGRQNNAKTWAEVEGVIDYWFKRVVLGYNYTISDYRILCSTIMTDELIRANKLNVKVQVRYNNSIKYITVFNEAYPMGVEFDNE